MSASANPTGSMNLVGNYGDDVVVNACGSVEVRVGDILIACGDAGTDYPTDDYYGEPASNVTRGTTVNGVKALVRNAFLGISKSYRSSLETSEGKSSDVLTVAIRGRAKLKISDAIAYPVGTLVGPKEDAIDTDSKYGILRDEVTVAASEAYAIGRLAKSITAADTTCVVEFESAIMQSIN